MNKEKNVRVEQATPQDAANIAKVHVASWRAAYKGIVADHILDGLDQAERAQLWQKILTQSELPCFLLIDEQAIIGFAHLSRSRDPDRNPSEVAEITAIYLDPARYRQGYGKKLMEFSLAVLARDNFSVVDIWVLEENKAARRFYEKLGFIEDGASKDLDKLGQREIRYTNTVKAPGMAQIRNN